MGTRRVLLVQPEGTDQEPSGAWSFVLDPIDDTTIRLISRLQVSTPSVPGKLIFYGFMEPAHFVMQQGMFGGLQERLEHQRSAERRREA